MMDQRYTQTPSKEAVLIGETLLFLAFYLTVIEAKKENKIVHKLSEQNISKNILNVQNIFLLGL